MAGPFDEEPVPGFDSIFSINFELPLIQLSIFRVVVCSFSSMKKFAVATCCYIYVSFFLSQEHDLLVYVRSLENSYVVTPSGGLYQISDNLIIEFRENL